MLITDLTNIRSIEGNSDAFAEVANVAETDGMRSIGRGWVFDGRGDTERLRLIMLNRCDLRKLNRSWPQSIGLLPALDMEMDGVLVSLFDGGILLLNRNSNAKIKRLPQVNGDIQSYPQLPREVHLPAQSLRWVDGQTGEVL